VAVTRSPTAARAGLAIGAVILAAALLRLLVALARSDLAWPDEHFQTLEPAAWLTLDRGHLSWEWTTGFRNWVVPGIYLPVFWLGDALGVGDGLGYVLAARALTALASVWALWRIDVLQRRLGLGLAGRLTTMVALGLSPAMIATRRWRCCTATRFGR
jgi:hypothetical protein